jgi:hypothetical protein
MRSRDKDQWSGVESAVRALFMFHCEKKRKLIRPDRSYDFIRMSQLPLDPAYNRAINAVRGRSLAHTNSIGLCMQSTESALGSRHVRLTNDMRQSGTATSRSPLATAQRCANHTWTLERPMWLVRDKTRVGRWWTLIGTSTCPMWLSELVGYGVDRPSFAS